MNDLPMPESGEILDAIQLGVYNSMPHPSQILDAIADGVKEAVSEYLANGGRIYKNAS